MKDEWPISVVILLYGLVCISLPLSISGTQLALGLLVVTHPLYFKRMGPEKSIFHGFPSLLFAIYLFVPFLSLVNSPNISISLPWIRRHFYVIIIAIVMITAPQVGKHWKKFLNLFVAASALAAGYAVLQVFFGETLSRPFFLKGYYVHSSAFFSQPNTLGEALTFSLLAAILAIWLARVRWVKILTSGSAFLILAGIISTRTRTPLAVASIAGVWLIVKLFGKRGFMAILLILILGLSANHLDDRLFWRFRQIGHHPGADRVEIWQYGLKAVATHPILGIGYGNFREFLKAHTDVAHRYLIRYNHAHCNILETAATTGMVGLIIFLLFWGRVAWDMFNSWRKARDPMTRMAFLTLFTAFLAFHAEGLTECTLKDAEVALPFYVLVGIFYALHSHVRARTETQPSFDE